MAAGELIVVGISGGVDSAVAALRLRDAGFDVHGLHMTNWREDDAHCSAAADYQAARAVCAELGIPLHRADFSAEYRRQVFDGFLADYAAGLTPNPDVLCNRHIKFGAFLRHAQRLGAARIATGHYARLAGPGPRLLRAADAGKDQTYFLHAVERAALARAVFPLGDLLKAEVRAIANRAGLPNHDRPDSTGICFIGERPFREFLARYVQGAAGPVLTPEGVELGRHGGLMFHTVGQRSGIGIGGRRGGGGAPWYVAAKDAGRNALVVVQGRDHPLLWSSGALAGAPAWIGAEPRALANGDTLTLGVRLRHRHGPVAARLARAGDGSLAIRFAEPQWAVAPGQYAVFYAGEECLGGAVVTRPMAAAPDAQAVAAASA